MLDIPGITPKIIAVVATTAIIESLVSFFFRDWLNQKLDWIRSRSKNRERWYGTNTEFLARLANIGRSIQAASAISEDQLNRINELSEDFSAHASHKPQGVPEEIHREINTISRYSGIMSPILGEFADSDSMAGAIHTVISFHRRMRLDDRSLDQIITRVPESDMEKIVSRIAETNQRTIHGSRNREEVSRRLASALDIHPQFTEDRLAEKLGELDYDGLADIPWEDVFEPIDERLQRRFVRDITMDFVTVFLVDIPEETIDEINKTK